MRRGDRKKDLYANEVVGEDFLETTRKREKLWFSRANRISTNFNK